MGVAPDRGLYVPTRYPSFSSQEIKTLHGKSLQELAFMLMSKFLPADDIRPEVLESVCAYAFETAIHIEASANKTACVYLDAGATGSYKDYSMRFLAGMYKALMPEGAKLTFIVATSGDTGVAAAEAFYGLAGTRLYLLYPKPYVTPQNYALLHGYGGNVYPVGIDGSYDDCARLVNGTFHDPLLQYLSITTVNSLNIGRIYPQMVPFVYAYLQASQRNEPVVFSLTAGNMGNALAAEMARRLYIPVHKIIVATGENDPLPAFLRTGEFMSKASSPALFSREVFVGNPSNLPRIFDLYGGTLDRKGITHREPDLLSLRVHLHAQSISDSRILQTIEDYYARNRKFIDPHGAAALAALHDYFERYPRTLGLYFMSSAPARYPELYATTGAEPELSDTLKKRISTHHTGTVLPPDYNTFRDYLISVDTAAN
jgi:threonine synthase